MHKRRHGRVRSQGVAGHLNSGDKLAAPVSVENLSLGGAFLRTDTPLPEGTELVLSLARPGLKRAIRLSGRVVSSIRGEVAGPHRRMAGMGVAFDPLTPDLEQRLTELLNALAAGPAVLAGDRQAALTFELEEPRPSASPPPRIAPVIPSVSPVKPPRPPPPPPPKIVPPPPAPPMLTPVREVPKPSPEEAKLRVHVQGLMLELAESRDRNAMLERENRALHDETERLRARIAALEARSAETKGELPARS